MPADPSQSAWRPVFAALSHPVVRHVYAAIVLGHAEPGADLSPSRRRHALDALLRSGLISEQGGRFVSAEVFGEVLRTAPRPERRVGVNRFLTSEGRIDRYPAKPADRAELLRRVVDETVRAGEELTEGELNERLARYHDDVATLRRLLVDHELVERRADGTAYARVAPR